MFFLSATVPELLLGNCSEQNDTNTRFWLAAMAQVVVQPWWEDADLKNYENLKHMKSQHWWHSLVKGLTLSYVNQISHPSWEAELISSWFVVAFLWQLASQLMVRLSWSWSLQPVICAMSYQDAPTDLLQNPSLHSVLHPKVAAPICHFPLNGHCLLCLLHGCAGWVRGDDRSASVVIKLSGLISLSSLGPGSECRDREQKQLSPPAAPGLSILAQGSLLPHIYFSYSSSFWTYFPKEPALKPCFSLANPVQSFSVISALCPHAPSNRHTVRTAKAPSRASMTPQALCPCTSPLRSSSPGWIPLQAQQGWLDR